MKPWSIQNEIFKRCQKEADYEWSKTAEYPIIKFKIPKVVQGKIGWYNLINVMLKELKP